jgi:eukaryotic-like serine/threonine-protein kinase
MSEKGPEPKPSERLGTVIGQRYKLASVLGEGGMAVVFLAEDLKDGNKRVALKILKREEAGDPLVLARFEREAVAMQQLAHEHIVAPLGFGQSPEGDMCLVMEHLEGESLRSTLKRLRTPFLADALEITRQIAKGLSRAHDLGVVHRDLKPENVMITWQPDGSPRVKILDFGMARLLTGGPSTPLTRKGAIFGTPEYMAPEQGMGQPVDARADQYALGVMLYEMLAGGRPFSAKSALEMVQKHIRETPPKLSGVAPKTPPHVIAAVERMMAKTPDERFPDVNAASAALSGR